MAILICKQFPRTQVTMMHAVQHNAHSLPRRDQSGNTDEVADDREHTPATASAAEGDDDVGDKANDDATDAKTASKDYTWSIAITDRPANEVRVALMTQCVLGSVDGRGKSSGVSGVLKGVKDSRSLTVR